MWPTADRWHALVRGQTRGVGPALARAGLRAASVPYGVGVAARNRLFDAGWKRAGRVPVPVVSVGNLSLGGTGKTPCVEYVAGFYRTLDLRVAILSRGYGATAGPNDEAMVLEENLPDVPHLQGPDRALLAATAVEELESDILVLDDGFQHRRLYRDLDIVLIDATRPPAADHLFPRGTLREPAGGLRRAGAIVLTRCDQAGPDAVTALRHWLGRRFPTQPVAATIHAPVGPTDGFRGKPVGAFCGLGHPGAFRRTLADLGAEVVAFRAFPDHHPYTRADVDDLQRWAAQLPADAVVATTQKDWVKLRLADLGGRPLAAVRVGLRFLAGEDRFQQSLRAVSREAPPSDSA